MTESAEHPYYLEIAVKPLHRHKKTLRELGITECVIGGFSIFFAIIAAGIARGETARYIMLPHTPKPQNPKTPKPHAFEILRNFNLRQLDETKVH